MKSSLINLSIRIFAKKKGGGQGVLPQFFPEPVIQVLRSEQGK